MILRPVTVAQLVSIWGQYAEYRRPHIAHSTYVRDYQKISRRLENMKIEAPDLKSGDEVRDYFLEKYSHETTRRTIQQLQASTRWAVFKGWLPANPFEGVMRYLPQARAAPFAPGPHSVLRSGIPSSRHSSLTMPSMRRG